MIESGGYLHLQNTERLACLKTGLYPARWKYSMDRRTMRKRTDKKKKPQNHEKRSVVDACHGRKALRFDFREAPVKLCPQICKKRVSCPDGEQWEDADGIMCATNVSPSKWRRNEALWVWARILSQKKYWDFEEIRWSSTGPSECGFEHNGRNIWNRTWETKRYGNRWIWGKIYLKNLITVFETLLSSNIRAGKLWKWDVHITGKHS